MRPKYPLTDYGWLLRKTYIEYYRRHQETKDGVPNKYNSSVQWDGGTLSNGRTCWPIWDRIVEELRSKGITDIDQFVASQFDIPRGATPPTPNTFLSENSVRKYRSFVESRQRSISASFGIQLDEASRLYHNALTLYKDHKRAVQSVILSKSASLTALFRYCLAVREFLFDEAATWYAAASYQYMGNRSQYDAVWGDFLPPCGVLLKEDESPQQDELLPQDATQDASGDCYV